MFDDVIHRFSERIRTASESKQFEQIVSIIEELKAFFAANPPAAVDVIRHFDLILKGTATEESRFAFIAAWSNLQPEYWEPLCKLLEAERCQEVHEPVVEILRELAIPNSVPSLSKAVQYRWDYDTWLHVPRKCLRALRSIGTDEAIAVIKSATHAPEEVIREEAQELLS